METDLSVIGTTGIQKILLKKWQSDRKGQRSVFGAIFLNVKRKKIASRI